jgi:carbon storage regulator
MLVLSRKLDEVIIIDGDIRVRVVDIRGSSVRLGIEAPPEVDVIREELLLKKGERRKGRCAEALT